MIVDFLAYKENRILDEIEQEQIIIEFYDGSKKRLDHLNNLWNEVRTQNVGIANAAGYTNIGDEVICTHMESFTLEDHKWVNDVIGCDQVISDCNNFTPEIFELEGIPTHDTLCPPDGGGEFPTLETPSITPIRIKSRRKFNWKRIWAWMGF